MQTGTQRPINILYVISSLSGAGAELVLSNLVRYLDHKAFNVSVCQLKEWGERGEDLAKQGYDVFCIADSNKARKDYFSFERLRKVILARQVDVVHSHNLHGLIDGSICRLLLPRIKLIHTFHFGNYPHFPPKYLLLEAVCSRIADHLVAVGDVQKNMIVDTYKLSGHSLSTIWNGVEAAKAAGNQRPADYLGADDRLIIGSMSTMTEQKGIPFLLQAAKQLKDLRDHFKFVIVGGGRLEVNYRDLAKRMGLEGFVYFTGWVKGAVDLLLPHFDIFLQTSLWEAMSMVLLEAMAAGKPVITTAVGEACRIIRNGQNGLLIDSGDVKQIVKAVRNLCQDAELRQYLAQNARSDFEANFTVDRMARSHEALYRQLLQSRH